MTYVALLRGINVGGNNRVEMPRLAKTFEQLGFKNVKTYINSGNVIFESEVQQASKLSASIEKAIEQEFGFVVSVIVRDKNNISKVVEALPINWANNTDMKCDVMFLWDEFDTEDTLKQPSIRAELEDVSYVSGAIIWRIERINVNRSGLPKIIGTPLYKKVTIRNCNTVRKLYALMNEK